MQARFVLFRSPHMYKEDDIAADELVHVNPIQVSRVKKHVRRDDFAVLVFASASSGRDSIVVRGTVDAVLAALNA